jgi:lipoyl(octanoyl) transferase
MSRVSPPPPSLEVYLLGVVPFMDAQRLQRRLVYDLGDGGGGGALILCEHPPTISIGRSGSRAHIRPGDDELRDSGIPVHWVGRGGSCVLHWPGQLAVSLILPLSRLGLDLYEYLERLNRLALGVLDEFDLHGATYRHTPGVFLGHARVASVGIAVNQWIAYHGLTLNVGLDMEPFDWLLDEPGIGPYRLHQTSMEARRQRPAPMAKVRESVIRNAELVFGLERHHLYTNHPLLRPEARHRAHVPSLG